VEELVAREEYFRRKAVEPSFVIGEVCERVGVRADPNYPVCDKNRGKPFRQSFQTFFGELMTDAVVGGKTDDVKNRVLPWIITMTGYCDRCADMVSLVLDLGRFGQQRHWQDCR
jgi:hypothetical protein